MIVKRSLVLLVMFLSTSVAGREARDIFKTEIFLTPYSEIGAEQEDYPRFNARVLALTGYTHYFGILDDSAQIPRLHWSSTQPQIEGAFVLQLTKRLSVRTKASLNSSTNETQDNVFTDLGVDLNNIFLSYTSDNYALYGGKLDVGYGDAWHVIDGLYSGFTEGAEYRAAVGLGARSTLHSNGAGTHSIAAVLFKRDESGLNKRWNFDQGLFRAEPDFAFSKQLKSFVLSYDVRGLPGLEGVSAGIDAGRLYAQPGLGENATMVSARLRYDTKLRSRWNLGWYSEASYASAFGGAPVRNVNGVSSISLSRERWQVVLTGAVRKMAAGQETLARYGLHAGWGWGISGAVTYVTESGFIVQAGLVRQRDQALLINQGVIRLAYQLEL